MKKLMPVLMLSAACFTLSQASAQAQSMSPGLYFAPKVFWSNLSGDVDQLGKYSDNVAGGALAVGYNLFDGGFGGPLRFEIEGAFRTDGTHGERYMLFGERVSEKYEVGVTSIFANAYYDFHNSTVFTPYIGGGLGTARTKAKVTVKAAGDRLSATVSSWDFAWNVGGGVAYSFTDKMALDLGYRYADFGTLTFSNVDLMDVTAHEVLLGGRFSF